MSGHANLGVFSGPSAWTLPVDDQSLSKRIYIFCENNQKINMLCARYEYFVRNSLLQPT
jgi:hypothetical protein